jgi:type I restriction enzyme S subunit
MSYLDKILDGVDIESKALGEICEFRNGFAFKSGLFKDSGLPIIRITNIDGKNVDLSNVKFFDPEDYNNRNLLSYAIIKGDILIAMSGATTSKIGYYNSNETAYLNQRVGKFEPNKDILNNRYLYHFLLTKADFIYELAGGGAQPNLSSNKLKEKLEVPIPCPDNPKKSLKIQKEIVRVLDTFSKLTIELNKELTKELKARKKQYSYYRENLLTFNESKVNHLPMDDESVGKFIRGKRFIKTDMISDGVPCIHYGEMYTHYDTWADKTKSFVKKELVEKKNLRLAEKGDVVLVAAGETIEDIGKGTAWLGEEGVVIHDACFYYKSDLNPKYVAYFTRTRQFHDQIKKHIRTGKISAINAKGLGKAIIPIPSNEEQERIVNILDKFDTLTTNISEALPKEIDLRKKQYEYYREKLLAFPKDTVEA